MHRAPLLSPPRGRPAPSAPGARRPPLLARQVRLALLHTLSLSRLGLAALFLLTPHALLRAGLVLLSGFTDVLDGWLARRAGLTTRLGALIDPVADRGFALTALLALLLDGLLTPLQVALLLLRDVGTALGFAVTRLLPTLRPVELKARRLGKLVTGLQMAALLAALLLPALVLPLAGVAGALGVAAVVDYTLAVWRARARA